MCDGAPPIVHGVGAVEVTFNRLLRRWEIDVPELAGATIIDGWMIPVGDETAPLIEGTAIVTAPVMFDGEIVDVLAWVNVAGSTTVEFDVKKNGTTIFATRPTIDASERKSDTAATPFALSSTPGVVDVVRGDVITVDIVQDGTDAAGPKVCLYVQRS